MDAKSYRAQISAELATDFAQPAPLPEPMWDEDIKILADPASDLDGRKAALKSLQAGMFQGSTFAPYIPEFLAALRKIAVAPDIDIDLRSSAFDSLTNLKDDFAREQLTAGLEGTAPALLPPAAALGMLARDDHGSALGIAHNLLTSDADVHVRAQAVRVLGSDPSSVLLLSTLLQDKAEFREVRQASAVALHGLSPTAFDTVANAIRADRQDFSDIKTTVGNALDRLQQ